MHSILILLKNKSLKESGNQRKVKCCALYSQNIYSVLIKYLPDPATTASLFAVAAVAAAHHNLGSKVWAGSLSALGFAPSALSELFGEPFLAFFEAAQHSEDSVLPSSLSEESLEPSVVCLVRLVPRNVQKNAFSLKSTQNLILKLYLFESLLISKRNMDT